MNTINPQYKHLPLITALYVALTQVSYVLAYKIVPLNSFTLPAGIVAFLLVYNLSDIVAEVYGYKRARRLLWDSIICNFIFVTFLTLLLKLPSKNAEQYNVVLGHTWRIYLGVLIGVSIGSFVNLYLFSKWKIWSKGRYFVLRCFISISLGDAIITAFTDVIAFTGAFSTKQIWRIIFTIYFYKIVYAFIASIPATLVVNYLKHAENLDVYDYTTDFNPFKMSVD